VTFLIRKDEKQLMSLDSVILNKEMERVVTFKLCVCVWGGGGKEGDGVND